MKILHLSRTMGQGGAEKIVYQLAKAGQNFGYYTYVVSSGGVYVDLLKEKQIPHQQVEDLECKNPAHMLQTLNILIELIQKEQIGILHAHHRMAAFYGRLLKFRFPDLQLVYTAHNVFENKKIFTQFSLTNTHIVAVGENVKGNLSEFFGVKPERIQVIYNAVEVETDVSIPQNMRFEQWKKEGCFLVGMIGRLSEQKGVDVFIRMVAQLKSKKEVVKGVIIGDGELREQLCQMIADNGLQEEILMMGYQEHVRSWIAQLDLVVMPSRWEGFPLLPMEVFSAGKTLVASDIGGINEIVRHEENGLLVPKNNVDVFSEAVIRLLREEKFRQQLEKNGQKDYQTYFSYHGFVEQYHALYEKIISEKR